MRQTVVIKLGGSALSDPATTRELATLVRGFQNEYYRVVVVHGGGPAINSELSRLGIQWSFIDGQRQTTPVMMDVIEQVLAHDVNSSLIRRLLELNVAAVGLSGARHKILQCKQASAELMQVGKIESVDTAAIENVLERWGHMIPVIAPIGFDKHGNKYNINADWAATQIAIAMKASQLIFLTDQKGILSAEKQPIAVATPVEIEEMIIHGVISGGMATKVRAMVQALVAGVQKIRVLMATDASGLLTEEKPGTLLVANMVSEQVETLHEYAR